MRKVEQQIRVFGAGFQRPPVFVNWLRVRAAELKALREPFTVLVIWGDLQFTAERLPTGEPIYALKRADGTIERPPWAATAAE